MARISIAVPQHLSYLMRPMCSSMLNPLRQYISENMPCSLIENWLVAGECAGG